MIYYVAVYMLIYMIVMSVLLKTAPDGYEDANGFHYSKKSLNKKGGRMKRVIGGLWLVIGVLLLIIATPLKSKAAEQNNYNDYNIAPTDTTTAALKSKYESELKKLKAAFEQIYLQIAHNDPQVNQRMQQLLEGNSKAVSLITMIQIYEKLVAELTEDKADKKEVTNKQRGKK